MSFYLTLPVGDARGAKDGPVTRFFKNGKLGHRFWRYQDGNREIRFCYSTHRNVAGNFLVWRETWTGAKGKRKGKRDQFAWTDSKKDAMDTARRRFKTASGATKKEGTRK